MVYHHQILGITCDNVSTNNIMVDVLGKVIKHFLGQANRV